MIIDCNLYSQAYVLEKKKKFINGYQLKQAMHVSYLIYSTCVQNINAIFYLLIFGDFGPLNNK